LFVHSVKFSDSWYWVGLLAVFFRELLGTSFALGDALGKRLLEGLLLLGSYREREAKLGSLQQVLKERREVGIAKAGLAALLGGVTDFHN